MKVPPGATTYCPPASILLPGHYQGRKLRHTFRIDGCKDWLLIFTVAGSGLYRFAEGGEYRSRAGDVTVHRPGVFHDYQITPGVAKWDLLWAHFIAPPDWLQWLNWPELALGLLKLTIHEPALRRRMIRRMKDVVRLNASAQPRGQSLGLNALEEVLIWCDSVNPKRSDSQPDARIAKAMDLLASRVAEPYSEKRVAGSVGLSPSRFRHLFRAQVGDSARNFQEQQRLRRARDLLAMSRQTIAEIAGELGFTNPFYFTLRFKKHTGESPRAFRQRITSR